MKKIPPSISELSKEERDKLRKLELVSAKAVGDTWEDDHELCTAVELEFSDGTKKTISDWWLSPEGYAAWCYAHEAPSALAEAKEMLAAAFAEED